MALPAMGHQPRPRMHAPMTRFQALRRQYVQDKITVEQFEERVALLLRYGRMDEKAGPTPPGWRADLSMWPVPAVNDLPEAHAYEPLPTTETSG